MTTRRHAVILFSLLLVALALPAAEITWYFQDSSTTPTTNRTFYIYPASIQTNGQAIITGDRLSVRLAADGTATNTLVGSEAGTAYQFVLPGPWTNTVGHIIVGTNATYAASTIYTNIEPPLESTSAYTMAQANARFIARNAGSGTNLTLRGTNTIQAISLGGETRTNWPTGSGGSSFDSQSITNLAFQTNLSNPAWKEGRVFYDATEKALSYFNSASDMTLQIGHENVVYGQNQTGITITNGQVVAIDGAHGDRANFKLASYTNDIPVKVVGLATHNIPHGEAGFVTVRGYVNGVDTAQYGAADDYKLFLGDVPGSLVTNNSGRPMVGQVVKRNANTGRIYVMPATFDDAHLARETALNLVSNQVVAASNNAAPLRMFDTVPGLAQNDDTNILWISAGSATGFTSGQDMWWNSSLNYYTNVVGAAAGRRIAFTNGLWVIRRTAVDFVYTNSTLLGTYQPGSGGSGSPVVVSYGTNVMPTQAFPQLAYKSEHWAMVGVTFDGGQNGWPPNNVDERGRFVISTDGYRWKDSGTEPIFTGSAGAFRDGSLMAFSNYYALAYTTNSATNASQAFSIALSTNLTQWFPFTNISPALTGETLTSVSRVWGPVFWNDDQSSNVWLVTAVATNYPLNSNFTLRAQSTHKTNFPNGWTTARVITNNTAYTNLIEIAPIKEGTNLYAFVTGDSPSGNAIRQMIFTNAQDLTSEMLLVNASPIGSWGGAVEGIWAHKLPSGSNVLYWCLYNGLEYGNFGDGHTYRYAITPSISSLNFTDPRVAEFDFYAQNFKPAIITNLGQMVHAQAGLNSGGPVRGIFNISGQNNDGLSNGVYKVEKGFNPWGDFAGVNLGTRSWPRGGFYAANGTNGPNGWVHLYAPTFSTLNHGNAVSDHGVTNVISLNSNTVAFAPGVVGIFTNSGNAATLSPTNLSIIGSNMNSLLFTNSTSSNGLAWNNGRFTVAGPTVSLNAAGVGISNGVVSAQNYFPAWSGKWAAVNVIGHAGSIGLVGENGVAGSGTANIAYYSSVLPPGCYTNLFVQLTFPTIATGTNVTFIVYTNGVSSGVTASINGVTAGSYFYGSNTTSSLTVIGPTHFTMVITNSSGAAINGSYGSWSLSRKLE